MTLSWSDPLVRPAVLAIVDAVRSQLASRPGHPADPPDRDEVAELIAVQIRRLRTDQTVPLPATLTPDWQAQVWRAARHAALAELVGLGRLQPLLDDETVQDIHINGCDRVWVVHTDGTKHPADPIADTDDDLLELGQAIARRHGEEGEQEWSETVPTAEVTLASGHRIELLREVALRPSLTIRRPDLAIFRLSQLVALGTLPQPVADVLSAAVRCGANLLVSGGTGAGKTTTMRCLLNEIGPAERLITIEDTRELFVTDPRTATPDGSLLHPDAVEILTRRPNAEGAGTFTLADGLRASKRMNPDRLIVGEVRSVEAAEMIDAMLGEAGGSLCTVHAASARAALDRLVYLAANNSELAEPTARRMVADAVDLVVWQHKDPTSGTRYVAEVVEVDGIEDARLTLHEAWRLDAHGRALTDVGPSLRLRRRLHAHGWPPSTGSDDGMGEVG